MANQNAPRDDNRTTALLGGSPSVATETVTIYGDATTHALYVTPASGSFPTSSSFGSAFPATGLAAGFNDGTNMQGARVYDINSGAGTEYAIGVNLRITGASGSTEAKGSALSASSIPVVIASDQGAVAITLNVPTTIGSGKTTVTTAGTRVTLAASTACKSVTIKALSTNTNKIFVGDATVASTNGFQLAASEALSLDITNLNTINLDATTSGEGVTYVYVV